MARRKKQRETLRMRQKSTAQSLGFQFTDIDESYQFLKGQAQVDALVSQYKKLAKRADQRLVRLEKAGKNQFAYARAMRDIREYYGDTAKRFNIQLSKLKTLSISKIEQHINVVLDFLNAPTSTVKGFRQVMSAKEQNIEDLSTRYGLSESQLISAFERGIIKKYESSFGSSTILKLIAKQRANKKEFDNWIREVSGKDIYSPKDADSLIKFMKNQNFKKSIKTEDIINFVSS